MYVITFYSFKGGVGRTQALVNSAAFLAMRQRRVLIVDFDLEAPGLWDFEGLRLVEAKPGLLDLIDRYQRERGVVPIVTDFISKAEMDGPQETPSLQIDVMVAGARQSYAAKYQSIDFQQLYSEQDGWQLFEDLRAQWASQGYDYVLIDSRTGYGEVSGICTLQLADCVAMVSALSEASVQGIIEANRHIMDRAILQDRVLITSRIPRLDDDEGEVAWRLEQLEAATGLKPMPIHTIDSLDLLRSSVVTHSPPTSRAFREYLDVSWRISWKNLNDPTVARVRGRQLTEQYLHAQEYEVYGWGAITTHRPMVLGDLWLRPPSFLGESVRLVPRALDELVKTHSKSESSSSESRLVLDALATDIWSEAGTLEIDDRREGGHVARLDEEGQWRGSRFGILERAQPVNEVGGRLFAGSELRGLSAFVASRFENALRSGPPSKPLQPVACIASFILDPAWRGFRAKEALLQAAESASLSRPFLRDLALVASAIDPTMLKQIIVAHQRNLAAERLLAWGKRRSTREVRTMQEGGSPIWELGSMLLRHQNCCELLCEIVEPDSCREIFGLCETTSILRALVHVRGIEEIHRLLGWVRVDERFGYFSTFQRVDSAQLAYVVLWIWKRTNRPLGIPEQTRLELRSRINRMVTGEWNFGDTEVVVESPDGLDGPEVRNPDSEIEGALAVAAMALRGNFDQAIRAGEALLKNWKGIRWIYPLLGNELADRAARAIEWLPMSILTLRPISVDDLRREIEYVVRCCRAGMPPDLGKPIDQVAS